MPATITVANLVANLQAKDDTFTSGLQGATGKATSWAAGIGSTVATAGLAVVAAGAAAAVAGVVGLGVAITKMTLDAAAVQGTVNTFDKLVQSVGGDSVQAMNLLRQATRGMVADADLMAASNKFLAMGIADTTEGAAELAEVSTQLGMAMGEDATASMENFALMMANQSIPRLDSFGISSSAVRERIKELMEETEGLSREQAFNTAVMEQAAITMAKVGEQSDTVSGSMASINTTIANAKLTIGQAFLPALQQLLIPLSDLASNVGPQVTAWAQRAGEWLGVQMPTFIEMARQAFENMMGTIQGDVVPVFENLKAWFMQNWPLIQAVALTTWAVIQDMMLAVSDVIMNEVWPTLQEAFASISEALAILGIDWGTLGKVVGVILAVAAAAIIAFVGVVTAFITGFAKAFNNLATVLKDWATNFQNIIENIGAFFTNFVAGFRALLEGDWAAALDFWGASMEAAGEVLTGMVNGIWLMIRATFGTMLSFIGGFVEGIVGFFQNLYDRLVGHSIIRDMMSQITSIISGGLNAVSTLWTAFKDNVIGITGMLKTGLDTVWINIQTALSVAWAAIKLVAETAAGNVWEAITTIIADIKTSIDTTWANIQEAAITAWENLKTVIGDKAAEIVAEVEAMLEDAVAAVLSFVGDFIQAGQDLLDGLIEGIVIKAVALYHRIRDVIEGALDVVRDVLDSESPSGVMFDIGVDFVQGLIDGVMSEAQNWFDVVDSLFDVSRVLMGLGSAAARVFRRETLEPAKKFLKNQQDTLKWIDKQIAAHKQLRDSYQAALATASPEDRLRLLQLIAEQEGQINRYTNMRNATLGHINRTTEEIAIAEARLAEMARQKEKIAFLKEQADLMRLITLHGLDQEQVLQGLQLGAGADPLAVLEAMTRAMTMIVAQAGAVIPGGVPGPPPVPPGPYGPQYNLYVWTVSEREDIIRDFQILQAMAGA